MPLRPQGLGAIEHRKVFGLEMRRAFERHRSADVLVGRSMSFFEKPRKGKRSKVGSLSFSAGTFSVSGQEVHRRGSSG